MKRHEVLQAVFERVLVGDGGPVVHDTVGDHLGAAVLLAREGEAVDLALRALEGDEPPGRLLASTARALSRPGASRACPVHGCASAVAPRPEWNLEVLAHLRRRALPSPTPFERLRFALAALAMAEVWSHEADEKRGAFDKPDLAWTAPVGGPETLAERVRGACWSPTVSRAARSARTDALRGVAVARALLGLGAQDHLTFGARLDAIDVHEEGASYRRSFDLDRCVPARRYNLMADIARGSAAFATTPVLLRVLMKEMGWTPGEVANDTDDGSADRPDGPGGSGGGPPPPGRPEPEELEAWSMGFEAYALVERIDGRSPTEAYAEVDALRRRLRAEAPASVEVREAKLLAALDDMAGTHEDAEAARAAGRLRQPFEPVPAPRPWRRWLGWAGLAFAVILAVLLVSRPPDDGVRLRGDGGAAELRVGARVCRPGPEPCRVSDGALAYHLSGDAATARPFVQLWIEGGPLIQAAAPEPPALDCRRHWCAIDARLGAARGVLLVVQSATAPDAETLAAWRRDGPPDTTTVTRLVLAPPGD